MFPFSVFTLEDSTTFEGSLAIHSMADGLRSIEKEVTGLFRNHPPLFLTSALSQDRSHLLSVCTTCAKTSINYKPESGPTNLLWLVG